MADVAPKVTDPTARKISTSMSALDTMDEGYTESPEETARYQTQNLNNLRITYRRLTDPKTKKILEGELEKGRGTDFPKDATLEEPVVEAQKSQPTSSTMPDGRRVGPIKNDTSPPNLQVETSSASPSLLEKGANAIRGFIEQNRDVIDNLIKQTTDSTEAAVKEKNAAADATRVAGDAAGMAANIDGAIEAAAAGTRARLVSIAGLDTTKTDNLFAKYLTDRMAIRKEREAVGADIDSRQAVGLFDNPLQYIVNATILPGKIAQYNALATRENNNVGEMESLQREVAAQETLEPGPTADLYLRRAAIMANMKASEATAKASNLRSEAAALVAQKTMQIAGLTNTKLNQQELASRFGLTLADRREQRDLKDQDRLDKEDLSRRLKLVGGLIGANLGGVEWLKGQGKDVQEVWKNRAASLNLGDSLAESSEFVRRFGDLNNMRTGGAAELAGLFRSAMTEIDNRTAQLETGWATTHAGEKMPKKNELRMAAADMLQRDWELQRDGDMFRAAQTNPYKVNHQKEALTFKGDPNNPVYQMVKDAYRVGQLVDDKVLFTSVRQLVSQGVLAPKEAASALSEYYVDSIRRNNTDRSIKDIGLEVQENYKVRPEGTEKSINLVNPVEVENHLTQVAIRSKAKASGFDPGYVPPGQELKELTPGYFALRPKEQATSTGDTLVKSAKDRAEAAKAGKGDK